MLPPQLRHNGPGAFGRCLAPVINDRMILSGCDNLLSHTAISAGHQLLAIMAAMEEVESDSGIGFLVSAVVVGWHFFCRRCVRDVEVRGSGVLSGCSNDVCLVDWMSMLGFGMPVVLFLFSFQTRNRDGTMEWIRTRKALDLEAFQLLEAAISQAGA